MKMHPRTDLPELVHLGKWLLEARTRAGLTQKKLASRSGTDAARISRIELGVELPTVPQLFQFAKVLGVSLQWFINGKNHAGAELPEIALELHSLGVTDLFVPGAVVPGAFRPAEQTIALAVSGDQPEPRIIEAIPAILAWNWWSHTVLRAYSQQSDPRAGNRIAWLAEVALTIHRTVGFPGGCLQRRELEAVVKWWERRLKPPTREDSLGRPAEGDALPPVSKRWKISYAAPLSAFTERARQLCALRERSPSAAKA
jgi:transcriptional regulator with XRE-family HTH domain